MAEELSGLDRDLGEGREVSRMIGCARVGAAGQDMPLTYAGAGVAGVAGDARRGVQFATPPARVGVAGGGPTVAGIGGAPMRCWRGNAGFQGLPGVGHLSQ